MTKFTAKNWHIFDFQVWTSVAAFLAFSTMKFQTIAKTSLKPYLPLILTTYFSCCSTQFGLVNNPLLKHVLYNIWLDPIIHGRGSSRCPWRDISSNTSQWTLRLSSYFMTLFLTTFVRSHWGHLKNRKKCFSNVLSSKCPPFAKKKFENYFFKFFCNKSYPFYLNMKSTCP